jgi:hypothetical protein
MPKPINDAVLGRFIFDADNDFWLGKLTVPSDDPPWLAIRVGPSDRRAVLALAREAVKRVQESEPEARRFLTTELVKSQRSGASKRPNASIQRAVRQLILHSVQAGPDGVLEFVFGNKEVFENVEFFVWLDRDGGGGVIVMDESQCSDGPA